MRACVSKWPYPAWSWARGRRRPASPETRAGAGKQPDSATPACSSLRADAPSAQASSREHLARGAAGFVQLQSSHRATRAGTEPRTMRPIPRYTESGKTTSLGYRGTESDRGTETDQAFSLPLSDSVPLYADSFSGSGITVPGRQRWSIQLLFSPRDAIIRDGATSTFVSFVLGKHRRCRNREAF